MAGSRCEGSACKMTNKQERHNSSAVKEGHSHLERRRQLTAVIEEEEKFALIHSNLSSLP